MSNNKLVVKDNALIDASFNLSLIEQRIMLLAIVEAREIINLSPDTAIEITVGEYIEQFKAESNNIYYLIKDAAKTLKRREFSYLDRYKDQDAYTTANWVNRVTYVDSHGLLVLYLSHEVISLISRLSAQFTKYYVEQVADFKSKYSLRLYELLIKWLSTGKTHKYNINEIRAKLGVEVTEYATMSNFKTNVLEKAIEDINKNTDITVSYDQFKKGRVITDFQFKLKQKSTLNTIPSLNDKKIEKQNFYNMSNAQINMFGNQLAELHDLSHLAVGNENYEALAARIKDMLKDPEKQKLFLPHLKNLGFNPKINNSNSI